MHAIGIRDLIHHFSYYLKAVKAGEHITILERHKPVADIIPHNENIKYPGWKREIKRKQIGGESFSATTERHRELE